MHRAWIMAGSAGLLFLVASCGYTLNAGADFDPGRDFGVYRTFTWDQPDELPTGDPRFDGNPFFHQRVRRSVADELDERGFRETPSDGDLLVHYHASVRDRVEVYEADEALGYETGDYGRGARVVQYEEGTLVVDVVDAGSRTVVWRGWAQADVEAVLGDPDRMQERIGEAVDRMFEEFPIPEGGGDPGVAAQ